jgi:hypothetical protein
MQKDVMDLMDGGDDAGSDQEMVDAPVVEKKSKKEKKEKKDKKEKKERRRMLPPRRRTTVRRKRRRRESPRLRMTSRALPIVCQRLDMPSCLVDTNLLQR